MTTTDDATTAGHGLAGPSPQPLGVLPWPAGMLVLPDTGPEGEAAAAALLAGGEPTVWPADWAFVAAALEGDSERAADLVEGDDVVAAYNRAVLVGGDWEVVAGEARGDLAVLAATARFSVGDTDEPPSAQATAGEVAAVARSARASAALEQGDVTAALAELDAGTSAAAGAGSPLLAATLRGSKAELLRHALDDATGAEAEATAALALLPTPPPEELHAELLVTRAMARQQQGSARPDLLTAAVADYLEALRVYREETHPELFATCNQHLALCYLQLPMGTQADRIRVGVAVNALRAALRVYTPETHPVAWASAQLNLANALQYLPSAHQAENLDEAVQLYEELLAHRDPRQDPSGTARILANQGNALGHLGVFSDARERLGSARELFAALGDTDSVAGVDEVLAGLAEAEQAAGGSGAGADPGAGSTAGEG